MTRSICLRSSNALRFSSTAAVLFILLASLACGSSAGAPRPTLPPTSTATVPQFGHVVLVVEENSSYSEVIGSSEMPYLNSLATQYGLAAQYFANTHPSIGNYFMLTTGQIVTNDDSFTSRVDVGNIVRELLASGKSWKSYAESRYDPLLYAKRHDPLSYFSDVVDSNTQMQNLTLLSQLNSDLANNVLPNFSFVVPNLLNDGHSGPLQLADSWLQDNIAPLISNANFQKDGLLIILFDEASTSDTTHGGGHVATLIISAKAKPGFQSTTLYQHQSVLRLILEGLGVSNLPGASGTAPEMGAFF